MLHLQKLTQKLQEIFQTDRADLDFGIYRILNSRRDKINKYLTSTLPKKVEEAFKAVNQDAITSLEHELGEAVKQAKALGVDADTLPKVQEIQDKLAQMKTSGSGSGSEAMVFSHLFTFFSRYYEEGDFISQRRYKGETYAIPYNGEEVMLHWANKDQYYTKSGENFSNYRFKLDDGREVFFRLMAADTAKDNRKDSNAKRLFSLVELREVERYDDVGEVYEERLIPIKEEGDRLEIFFEYVLKDKADKQEKENERTLEQLHMLIPASWQAVWQEAPTEKNPKRTLLEKHLNDYTQKNSADYFIHKDLGSFLRRELDFYIKNEVLHLDNIQHAEHFDQIKNSLRQIQVLRTIAHDLIDFLAQIEDFQKSLWLKKKFVAQTHYLITLDRIPKALLPETLANEKQLDDWKKLFNFNYL
ncbi:MULTISPECIES: restriction endonuclease subunit M [unclassified Avibacterium]|uniref:restriction endonuclease subunit M n=1 Tax=unclassified Avibacterium TaxID=2685287 RepID=UPI0020270134|nr:MULTISPECIES: restriction endonuclease subunit M [unclassified Avibacterium]MCW9699109.1 restriction endonuclease subunit M [Avibacterium sp. 20-129]URL06698.1 restriction endonuclease subunit M [Avibacterium sp. 21-595]